jgi:hypothetical protein
MRMKSCVCTSDLSTRFTLAINALGPTYFDKLFIYKDQITDPCQI